MIETREFSGVSGDKVMQILLCLERRLCGQETHACGMACKYDRAGSLLPEVTDSNYMV